MSTDNSNNNPNTNNSPQNEMHRQRRGSVTQQAIAGLFRSNSTSTGAAFPTGTADAQRRRLSVSTGLGLTGTSPTGPNAFNSLRRGSLSTNSQDSIDENAVDEEELPPNARTAPTTPFTRRMSFGAQAMRNLRTGGGSPGSNGNNPPASASTPASSLPITPAPTDRRGSVNSPRSVGTGVSATPPNSTSSIAAALSSARRGSSTAQASNAHRQRSSSDVFSRPDQGFNWSEQLRSRAESSVQGSRPSFSFGSGLSTSPPRGMPNGNHDRTKSVSDMPAPPAQAAAMKPKAPERPKPDAFQERILKGDFYMD
ncbi:hypothetical protein CGCS363_v000424 [Colletotrichum siamense]|uniref:uncharacterized protein n=1 Tax=Colletotrichum siamense TaxID=690259 RepID=UPI0018724AB1|nr:uncharacterized protein CGCS363_v000424 [Colletotrichum siamense]KAF5515507.1 hypothetical protein CGCS363_v000424 [Colletotrichum siamense]